MPFRYRPSLISCVGTCFLGLISLLPHNAVVAKQKIVFDDSFLYNCQEQLWSSQLIRPNIYPGDWMTIDKLEERSGKIGEGLKQKIKSACASNDNVQFVGEGKPSRRLFNENCQDITSEKVPFSWTLDYLSEFNTNNKNFLLFAIRGNDGSQILCLSNQNLKYSVIQLPKSGFIQNITRLNIDNPVWQYEYHPGNGWGYTVTKYQMNLENPKSPHFTIIDSWTKKRQ